MSADHRAIVSTSADRAADVAAALEPEEDAIPGDTRAVVTQKQREVEVVVDAPDVPSLRAAVAGWSSLLAVAVDATEPC